MDADDAALPERLARQIEVLAANPDVAVLGSECELIDAGGASLGRTGVPGTPARIREALLHANCVAHPTVMMRLAGNLAVGGYRHAFALCEDYDLWLRLAERHDLMNLSEVPVRYRCHDGQIFREPSQRRALAVLAAQHAARERRAGRADPAEYPGIIDGDALRRMGIAEATIRAVAGEPPPPARRRRNPIRRLLRAIAKTLLRPLAERDALGPGDMWHRRANQRAAWGHGRIFVIIPSYRDPECQWASRELFAKARDPDRISVGVVRQVNKDADAHCLQQGDAARSGALAALQPHQDVGCSWARHQCLRLWRGEEYALQIDSHMRFVEHRDAKMLAQLDACPSPRPLLTARPLHYDPPNELALDAFAGMGAVDFDDAGILHVGGYLGTMGDAPKQPMPTTFCARGLRVRRISPADRCAE